MVTCHHDVSATSRGWMFSQFFSGPKFLSALCFAGKNDTSIKNSGPETSLPDPLPDSLS